MNIKLITTEKKLSKSIINQLPGARPFELKNGTALGFLLNVRKNHHKTLLIESNGIHYVFPSDYKKGKKYFWRKIGKWTAHYEFPSEEACNEHWEHFQDRLKEAVNQIFI